MAANKKPISLGNIIRDITTGMTGTCTSRTDFMTGNVQYTIQPTITKGASAAPEGLSCDELQLDYVSAGAADRVTPAPDNIGITLGHTVTDIVSGFTGIATKKITFMNGCVYYVVVAKMSKNGTVKEAFCEYQHLTAVDAGVVHKLMPKPKTAYTGGPNTKPYKR